jgi:hypothetical protein
MGDRHSDVYNSLEHAIPFYDIKKVSLNAGNDQHCLFTFHLYPTDEFEVGFHSTIPAVVTTILSVSFLCIIVAFTVYSEYVRGRNEKVCFSWICLGQRTARKKP